jgi:hypothetical protein
MPVMKCNPQRTVKKQREAAHTEWLKKRQEALDAMTMEEREKFLKEEKQRIHNALSIFGLANSMITKRYY